MKLVSKEVWRAGALALCVLWIADVAAAQICFDVNVRFAGRDPSPVTIQSMQKEAATIWQPYGVRMQWPSSLPDSQCPLVAGSFDVLIEDQPSAAKRTSVPPVLGSTRLVAGRIDRAGIYVDYDETKALIDLLEETDLLTLAGHPDIGPGDIGRALGRILAHEIGHVVLGASMHEPFGLMRRAFAPADLVRLQRWAYTLSKKEVERLGMRERELSEAVRAPCGRCAAVVRQLSVVVPSHIPQLKGMTPDALSATGHSFDEVVLPHLGAAHRLARWLMRNEQDAEDVVQDASLRALRYFDSFTGGNGRAWFLRIVRNTCYMRHGRQAPVEIDPFDEEHHTVRQALPDPETQLLRADTVTRIDRAIATLPARAQEILVLRELEALSYHELAEALDMPAGTVMSALFRARRGLRAALEGGISQTQKKFIHRRLIAHASIAAPARSIPSEGRL